MTLYTNESLHPGRPIDCGNGKMREKSLSEQLRPTFVSMVVRLSVLKIDLVMISNFDWIGAKSFHQFAELV